MIKSRSQSPDNGMSSGMTSTCEAALTTGASTGLKKNPVKFVKKKSEIIAKGANFAERKWSARGNIRGNFIFLILHVSDGPGTTKIASSNRGNCGGYLPHLLPGYVSLRMANRFKEHGDLEIETADKMGFLLRWLLYFRCFCPSM